jgi:hypothetical protein
VIQEWDVNADGFEYQHEGQTSEELDLIAISPRAIGGKGVRDEMLKQERANRDDPA